MAQRMIYFGRRRLVAYQNLTASFDTDNDTNEAALEKLTTLDVDRKYNRV